MAAPAATMNAAVRPDVTVGLGAGGRISVCSSSGGGGPGGGPAPVRGSERPSGAPRAADRAMPRAARPTPEVQPARATRDAGGGAGVTVGVGPDRRPAGPDPPELAGPDAPAPPRDPCGTRYVAAIVGASGEPG